MNSFMVSQFIKVCQENGLSLWTWIPMGSETKNAILARQTKVWGHQET